MFMDILGFIYELNTHVFYYHMIGLSMLIFFIMIVFLSITLNLHSLLLIHEWLHYLVYYALQIRTPQQYLFGIYFIIYILIDGIFILSNLMYITTIHNVVCVCWQPMHYFIDVSFAFTPAMFNTSGSNILITNVKDVLKLIRKFYMLICRMEYQFMKQFVDRVFCCI